ncbi:DUF6505 family protein [Bosea caraganae]|uniref:DUF6505 family protein n=1 Tax=Bosea caraganae TaxID=2763117 RepID=UPI001FEA3BB4|nr:DUF6505 family protein [Bosea caraganae]
MKLLRTIRLDPSDSFVFPAAAEPGEWAVTGSFLFWGRDPAELTGKERSAFRAGFVGVDSLGFSTLVVAQPIRPEERLAAVEALAGHLVARLGAPDLGTARIAAEEEIAFAMTLAEHEEGTLIALHRSVENGELREQYRTLTARERVPGLDGLHAQARAFSFHEVVEDDGAEERVDLIDMMETRK